MSSLFVKKHSVILGILFLYALPAYAGFEITEIMYDLDGTDTDREWVEVQNTGSASDDLSKWFFFSGNTKHALTPDTSSMVPAGGYAVIAQKASKFKLDWPNFSGLLFDSSWTGLNNTGDTIALKDPALVTVGAVTYASSMGASGDGNTLQKSGSTFAPGAPTPGVGIAIAPMTTQTQVAQVGGAGGIGSPASLNIIAPPAKKETEAPKINTEIITKSVVVAHVPFQIGAVTTGYSKEPLTKGKFVWNFGDGMLREDLESKKFSYTYEYTGEYVLTLAYYRSYYDTEPNATDRMIVKVIDGGIAISSVGTPTDAYVELENTSSYEILLSGWKVTGAVRSFTIPEGTILLPSKKLKLSPHRTLFNSNDIVHVSLYNPAGDMVSTFPTIVMHTLAKVRSYETRTSPYIPSKNTESALPVDLNTLGASARDAHVPVSTTMLAWLGLGGLIVLGSAATFVIHKPRKTTDHLEDTLRAHDMTIVE